MFPKFYTFLIFFQVLAFSYFSSTVSAISYNDHCASIIPELKSTDHFHGSYPLLQISTKFYNGGERILGNKSSSFYATPLSFYTTKNVYNTTKSDILKIEAYLKLPIPQVSGFGKNSSSRHMSNYSSSSRQGELKFLLNGYWSESSGKLCMVGSASGAMNLESVLILDYAKNSPTIFTSIVSGTFSISNGQNSVEPISITAFPEELDYKYTLVTKEFNENLPEDLPSSESLSLHPQSICSILRYLRSFELEYSKVCEGSKSSKNCTLFDGIVPNLSGSMDMSTIQCSGDEHKLRYLMEFPNTGYSSEYYYHPSDLNTTLIGEGSWDRKKNRLNIVACRILNSRVSDCSTKLTLRFPSMWNIRNSNKIVGHLWTNKSVNDSGYFNKIMVKSSDDRGYYYSELKYEYTYTELENVKKSCKVNKPVKENSNKYPNGHSQDLRIYMSAKDTSHSVLSWGDAYPISVGDELYEQFSTIVYSEGSQMDTEDEERTLENGSMNISYRMRFTQYTRPGQVANNHSLFNFSSGAKVEITAEGVYDAETGHLCMIGCRKLTGEHMDCEILVNFDFPPVNARKKAQINGTIESTRKKTDPFYFERLNVISDNIYMEEAREIIWRMDLEIVMVLISSTFACIFIGSQLIYVRKHPEILPSISFTMLVILTLGYMIPLVLNFEAMFLGNSRRRRSRYTTRSGWIEVNEVIVRVITLFAFLLVSRLLQKAWLSRSADQKGSWIAERKVLFICLPIYIIGGLITILIKWKSYSYQTGELYEEQQHTLWVDFRSYGGLIVDGFLLPQILLNMFLNSRESALTLAFYIGTTLVRLVPHCDDLLRIPDYSPYNYYGSYMYGNPGADLYSTAWDVVISCGGIFLVVIIFFQQKFGGKCIIPKKLRELELYEKVPTTSGE